MGARLGQLQSNCQLKPGIPVLTNLNCVLKMWSNTFCGRTMETSSRWLCCWIIWRAASRSESPWLGKMQPRAMGSGMRPPLCCIVSAGRRPPPCRASACWDLAVPGRLSCCPSVCLHVSCCANGVLADGELKSCRNKTCAKDAAFT